MWAGEGVPVFAEDARFSNTRSGRGRRTAHSAGMRESIRVFIRSERVSWMGGKSLRSTGTAFSRSAGLVRPKKPA